MFSNRNRNSRVTRGVVSRADREACRAVAVEEAAVAEAVAA